MFSLIERVMTAANARCSYMGCTRRRHTGPCNVEHHEHVAPMQAKAVATPVVEVAAMATFVAMPAAAQARETVAPPRRSGRPSRSPGSMAPPPC